MKDNNIPKILETLGLSREDIQLFFVISKNGPVMENELATIIKMSEKRISKHLKILTDKGLIKKSIQQPVLFFPTPFENALDLLLEIYLENTNNLQRNKKDLLKEWNSFVYDNNSS